MYIFMKNMFISLHYQILWNSSSYILNVTMSWSEVTNLLSCHRHSRNIFINVSSVTVTNLFIKKIVYFRDIPRIINIYKKFLNFSRVQRNKSKPLSYTITKLCDVYHTQSYARKFVCVCARENEILRKLWLYVLTVQMTVAPVQNSWDFIHSFPFAGNQETKKETFYFSYSFSQFRVTAASAKWVKMGWWLPPALTLMVTSGYRFFLKCLFLYNLKDIHIGYVCCGLF